MKCDICGGKRKREKIVYSIYYNQSPIIIENVPADVCEQCGEQFFDPETVEMIQQVVWSSKTPKRTIATPVYDLAEI